MKKILLFCFIAIAVSSCNTYNYSYQGDVELLSNDGRVIEKWDNAVFSKGDSCNYIFITNHNIAYKNSGLEFLTEEGEHMYINGGIIIVRGIRNNIQRNPAEEYEEENRDYL